MSGLTLTVDDGSPLIKYQPEGAWTQQNSSTDPTEAINFHSKTCMVTQTSGATISFVFEGVSVVVYGTTSPKNGNYTVDIDGIVGRIPWTGKNSSIQYGVPIYISRPLNSTTHTITILNKNNGSLNVDYITWNAVVDSKTNGTLSHLVLDDIDPSFNYYKGSWSTTPLQAGNFRDNTGHSTSTLGSAFNLTFSGNAISLYGSVGPSNGAYTVQLDDQLPETLVATEPTYVAQTLLYYGNDLGPGNHTLHVVNEEDSLFEIDYVEVFTLPNFPSNVTSAGPSPTETTSVSGPSVSGSEQNESRLSAGAVAGISVGVVFVLLIVLLVGFYKYFTSMKTKWIREREASTVSHSSPSVSSLTRTAHHANMNVASSFSSVRQTKSTLVSPVSPCHKLGTRDQSRQTSPLIRELQHRENFDERHGS